MAYARTVRAGDGSTRDYVFSFPYLSRDHVRVFVDGVLETAWSFQTADTVRFDTAPADGAVIIITRQTSPTVRLVDYAKASSLNEEDLDTDSLQAFYLAQEAFDISQDPLGTSDVHGQFSARMLQIKDLADPTDPDDAATKGYVDQISSDAINARDEAVSARDAAEFARDEAQTSENNAAISAQSASDNAAIASTAADDAETAAQIVQNVRANADSVLLSFFRFDPTQGQTVFSGTDADGQVLLYTPGNAIVFLNGVALVRGIDWSEVDGEAFSLAEAVSADDVVVLVNFSGGVPTQAAEPVLPTISAQSWTVDDETVSLDASASGDFLTFSYGANGLPQGLSLDSQTGMITGIVPDEGTGTAVVSATDQFGRTATYSFTWSADYRAVAQLNGSLGPYSFEEGEVFSVDLSTGFTANGNTLTFAREGTQLPAGASISSAGILSGTVVNPSTGTYTVRATDEYGRTVDSSFSFEITEVVAPPVDPAPQVNSISYDEATQTLDVDLSENATAVWASADPAEDPTFDISTGWAGMIYESGSFAAEDSGNGTDTDTIPLTETTPDGSRELTLFFYDAGNNLSTVSRIAITVSHPVSSTAPTFEGDAAATVFGTTHTLDSTSTNQNPLPATFTAGTKLVVVHSAVEAVSGVVVDGVTATQRGSDVSGMYFFEATITGGNTNNIVVTTANGTDRCNAAMYDVGDLTFQAVYTDTPPGGNDAARTAEVSINTIAGDAVFGVWNHYADLTYTPTNLALDTDDLGNNARFMTAVSNLNASGGTPEVFSLAMDGGYFGAQFAVAHYG